MTRSAIAGVTAVTCLLLSGGAGAAARTAAPVELARLPAGVTRIAADGGSVAVATWYGGVYRIDARTRRVGRSFQCDPRRMETNYCDVGAVAAAGRTVVWTNHGCGNDCYWFVKTQRREISEVSAERTAGFSFRLAADGSTIGYAWVASGWETGDTSVDIVRLRSAGVNVKVGSRRAAALFFTLERPPTPTALAVSGTRVAVLFAGPSPRVAVFDGVTRAETVSIPVSGARGIALSSRFVAVLARSRIDLYSATTGHRLGTLAVPSNARSLSADGQWVVFAAGRGIYLLDATTKRVRRIATARMRPVGPAIDGRRVVWAEGRRILAVRVP